MSSRLTLAATVLLLIAALALHWRVASFMLGRTLLGDEQKHFTSGVMVYDYLRTGLGSNPVRFAEDYEVRYPEIAIGHWPPMYYAVQAPYYLLAGPTIRSAQILSAMTAGCLAVLLVITLASRAGAEIAVLAAAILLASPQTQASSWQVMSDLLTGLFVFAAILAFSNLLDKPGHWKHAVTFAACSVAAILTKGSAWALGPFAIMAPLLSRRMQCFRNPWFFGAGVSIVAFAAPFYVLTQRSGVGYEANYSHLASRAVGLGDRLSTLLPLLKFAPALLIGISALGLVDALYGRWWGGDESSWTTLSLVAAAWIASQALFLFILPLTSEPRVLIPSLAPAAILVARLLCRLKAALRRTPVLAAAAPVVLGTMIVANAGAIPLQRFDGYRRAADVMPYPSDGALILVATDDKRDEGALVTERLAHDRFHKDVILRGTHVLASVDSAGNDRPRFQSPDAIRNYLLQMPVRFVVLSSPPYDFSYQGMVESAVLGDPGDFRLLATVPIQEQSGGQKQPTGQIGELRIYENPEGRDHRPSVVRTPLGFDAGRRVLEYRWR